MHLRRHKLCQAGEASKKPQWRVRGNNRRRPTKVLVRPVAEKQLGNCSRTENLCRHRSEERRDGKLRKTEGRRVVAGHVDTKKWVRGLTSSVHSPRRRSN